MTMVGKYQRPAGVYAGDAGLANRAKYQDDAVAVPKRAISSAKMDGDLNYLVDAVNQLDTDLLNASLSGSVPGQSGHAGKFLTTDGSALSWDGVDASDLADGSVTKAKLENGTANRLMGYDGSGLVGEVSVGSGLSLVSGVLAAAVVGVPSGVVVPFAGAVAPSGWMMCDGSAVSRATYADLFTAVGTVFGSGDGSTTFNLPDLRGRSVFGVDAMGGSAASRVTSGVSGIAGGTLGAVGGNEAMQGHTHTVTDPGHTHGENASSGGGGSGTGIQGLGSGSGALASNVSTVSATTGITVASYGSGGSQNMPPAMMLNYIVKA
ncbi:MAG: phage tail protein [Alphaproteobacteria bacterium]